MLWIGRVASGPAAVAYFTGGADARAAGCGVGYYTRDDTTAGAGRWVGSGAAALGLSGALDEAGVRVLAGLLDGVGPDGARLVEPVLRADPAGRVPALPIVTAARAAGCVHRLRCGMTQGPVVVALLRGNARSCRESGVRRTLPRG